MYGPKLGVPIEKMVERLWGDNFFNAKEKKWTNNAQGLPRAFCQFIMDPIIQLVNAIMSDNKMYERMIGALGIELSDDEKALTGTPLMQRVMQKWINAADNLLAMIVSKLPSPREAQKYRVQNLYEGPMDDAAAQGIRNCDPSGPLMMYLVFFKVCELFYDEFHWGCFFWFLQGVIGVILRLKLQVCLEDGAHKRRRRSLLCFWSSLFWHHCHRPGKLRAPRIDF